MAQEIESVKAAISVVIDDGDFIINSTGPVGKAMSQAILPLAASAKKITVITDGEMRVMKRNGTGLSKQRDDIPSTIARAVARAAVPAVDSSTDPDIQDQFAADLEAGVTGEAAMGEQPQPTPGPSDPVAVPAAPKTPARRKPQIFQDAAAPPAPELAEAEMDRLLAEAQQAEQDQARVAEQQRFQSQQAVQAGDQSAPTEAEAPVAPRKRTRERQLATTGRPCGRCGGGGQIVGEAGFTGACPVCLGQGQIKSWDRSLKVR
jgi:hypothetical protein